MEKTPEFSVILTVYNKARFIGEAIKSVLGQSFADLELIIVDDGSTDGTKGVVTGFSDPRIRYIHQAHSGLPAVSRNAGMRASSGKYIAFLDGDDYWERDKLARCKYAFDNMPEAALICHNERVTYNGKITRFTAYGPYVKDMYMRLLLKGNCLHASSVCLRREVFSLRGEFFDEDRGLYAIEDYEYWLRLSKREMFYFLKETLGYYRVCDEGSYLSSAESNTRNLLRLLDKHFSSFGKNSVILDIAMKRRRSSVMCGCARMFLHKNNFSEAKKWYTNALMEFPANFKAALGYLAALLKVRAIYS